MAGMEAGKPLDCTAGDLYNLYCCYKAVGGIGWSEIEVEIVPWQNFEGCTCSGRAVVIEKQLETAGTGAGILTMLDW